MNKMKIVLPIFYFVVVPLFLYSAVEKSNDNDDLQEMQTKSKQVEQDLNEVITSLKDDYESAKAEKEIVFEALDEIPAHCAKIINQLNSRKALWVVSPLRAFKFMCLKTSDGEMLKALLEATNYEKNVCFKFGPEIFYCVLPYMLLNNFICSLCFDNNFSIIVYSIYSYQSLEILVNNFRNLFTNAINSFKRGWGLSKPGSYFAYRNQICDLLKLDRKKACIFVRRISMPESGSCCAELFFHRLGQNLLRKLGFEEGSFKCKKFEETIFSVGDKYICVGFRKEEDTERFRRIVNVVREI